MLKERLSEYVARVRLGEHVIVTDRGEAVAELVPLSAERAAIQQLVRSGKANWLGGKPLGLDGVIVSGAPLAETVIEDRR